MVQNQMMMLWDELLDLGTMSVDEMELKNHLLWDQ